MFRKTLEITPVRPPQFEESIDVTEPQGSDPFLKYKIFKQVSLIYIWICLGFFLEMVGPTLPDLKDRIGVDYEEISRALIAISIGILVGSLGGGFLHERFYRQTELILFLSLLVASVSTVIVPYAGKLSLVGLCFFINGAVEGFINTGGNTMVMHMWGEKAAAPMHSLHFGFGFGAIIAPQVAKPFLKPRNLNQSSSFSLTSDDEVVLGINTSFSTPEEQKSRTEYAFIAAGIVTFCCSLLWLGIYIKGPPKQFPRRKGSTKFSKKMFSPATCARGDFLYGTLILAVLFFFFIQCTGGQRAYGRFLLTFLIESDLKFKTDAAANLNSLFWASFTVGRATGIPISHFVSPPVMICVQSIALLITSVILAIWVFPKSLIIWIFSVPMGYFMAQVFPSGMSWSNIYLDMNSIAVMVLFIGTSAGGVIYQYLPGYLLKNYGQETLMYVMVAYGAGLVLAFVLMQILAKLYTKRNPTRNEFEEDVPEIVMSKRDS